MPPVPAAGSAESESTGLIPTTMKSAEDPEAGRHDSAGSFHVSPAIMLEYELPKTVTSVRDGWQWTCQSAAVVSGLLAAVAAQLLVFFKSSSSYATNVPDPLGAQGFLIASCYAALLLNISATISSFILIDNLGELGLRAASKDEDFHRKINRIGRMTTTQDKLLVKFGASRMWKSMLWHWLATFYLGILALIISVQTYVTMEEPFATKVFMWFMLLLTLFPTSYFIFGRPIHDAFSK